MTEHQEQADRAERDLDELQHESDRLGAQISGARQDWERKKADPSVPGAGGDPAAAEGDLPPEGRPPS